MDGMSLELARRPRGLTAPGAAGVSLPATRMDTNDKFREECGLFGIYNHSEAANLTYLGLYALQHRGQESVGIASSDGDRLQVHKAMGYVADSFDEATFARLAGMSAVGHVRYSTAGESGLKNAQPILIECAHGEIAIAHNGNLVNAQELRDALVQSGSIFQTTSDTEVLLHLYARSKAATPEAALVESVSQAQGAFSLVLLTKDRLIAVRDPHGFRPLTLGKLGDGYIVCSETCALDLIDAEWIRDIEPGEMLVIGPEGMRSMRPFAPAQKAHCIFEHVYFARPDSYVFGRSVNEVRTEFGRRLAIEQGVDADVVVPIPDSGVCAATGFAEKSGIPLKMGLIRNHYVGRTFIEPHQAIRHFGVRVKLNPVRSILQGRRVVLIDDSIVRGTTSRKIVKMVRSAGASEVHMRISCPPTISPCFYGVDTPRRSELIAATHSLEEIRRYIGADTLGYLSVDGLLSAVGTDRPSYCTSCYTGNYPVAFPRNEAAYLQLALKLTE
jgi:amidophosphoribosyltransferase